MGGIRNTLVLKFAPLLIHLDEKDYGTCIVRFIVDTSGMVYDVRATTMQGTTLAKVAVDAIRKGPRWEPAMQNGHKVNAFRIQPVTLQQPPQQKMAGDSTSRR